MTEQNLTFSIEIDFIPDMKEGRASFQETMKKAAAQYHGTYVLDPKKRPVIAGLDSRDVEKVLVDIGLSAFGTWPACVLTCTIGTPLPIRAVGMSDGWDIYTGEKKFFAFAQFPADTVEILTKACTYYLDRESFQTFDEFVNAMGYETFRDEILGNSAASPDLQEMPGSSAEDGAYWGSTPAGPPLTPGDFIRPEHNVMQIIEVYPEMGPLLMEYGMSCVGCFISYDENLWQACQAHGMDVFEMLGEMNEYIADKYGKSFLTEETPMQDVLTLYPQVMPVFKKAGVELPSDMETPIGEVCRKSKADPAALIGECHKILRKEV